MPRLCCHSCAISTVCIFFLSTITHSETQMFVALALNVGRRSFATFFQKKIYIYIWHTVPPPPSPPPPDGFVTKPSLLILHFSSLFTVFLKKANNVICIGVIKEPKFLALLLHSVWFRPPPLHNSFILLEDFSLSNVVVSTTVFFLLLQYCPYFFLVSSFLSLLQKLSLF